MYRSNYKQELIGALCPEEERKQQDPMPSTATRGMRNIALISQTPADYSAKGGFRSRAETLNQPSQSVSTRCEPFKSRFFNSKGEQNAPVAVEPLRESSQHAEQASSLRKQQAPEKQNFNQSAWSGDTGSTREKPRGLRTSVPSESQPIKRAVPELTASLPQRFTNSRRVENQSQEGQ